MTEVCAVVDVSQFSAGHSAEKCGFYAISLLKYAGLPGSQTIGSPAQVEAWADTEYVAYDGPDVSSNDRGMTMAFLEDVLDDASLHYQVIGSTETGLTTNHLTPDYVRAWLRLGYPVILAVAESSVYDLDLGGCPYAWDTSNYFHIILATGADGSALLCHDTASIGPAGVRPGPRRYDAGRLTMISATAVVMPWLRRPVAGYDPIASGGVMIPAGWHDDGTTLTAPNNHRLTQGFRQWVLNQQNFDAGNQPQEEVQAVSQVELHNPAVAGTRQILRDQMLVWTPAHGVHTSAAGMEIKACYDQIAALKAQLKAAQTPVAPSKVDVTGATAALQTIANGNASVEKGVAALHTALGVQ